MNLLVLQVGTAAGFVMAVLGGIILYRRLLNWGPLGRIAGAFLPLLALIGLGDLIIGLINTPYSNWNSPRLAPAFALGHGFAMYYGPDNGPVLGNIYGPGLALAYLPTVILPLPSLALKGGLLLTSAYYFLPVILLHLKTEMKGLPGLVLAGTGTIWFMFMTGSSPPLSYVAFAIHADAPAISLCGLACFFLYGRTGKHSVRTFIPAALCSVLAVWTKQTMVPILLALPLYLWLGEGRRVGLAYLRCLTLCAVLISAVFLGWLGVEPVLFNMFVIPGHHPWCQFIENGPLKWLHVFPVPPRMQVLLDAFAQLLIFCQVPLGTVSAYFVYKRYFSAAKLVELRAWFATQPWILLALTGLCMAPTSILGRVKIGGDINSFSFSSYFIFLAASLILVQVANRIFALEFQGSVGNIRRLSGGILLVFTFSIYSATSWEIRRDTHRGSDSADQAFDFIKTHPGECYFPWDPLVHLMAEGRLYHFCYGVFDRELAGYPLSREHILQGLPPQLKVVVFGVGTDRHYALKYLPEFSKPDLSFLKEMPAAIVYVRK